MKPLTILAAFLACSLGAGAGQRNANTNRKPPPTHHTVDPFKKLDKNHDGFLSPEEFAAGGKYDYTPTDFKRLDTNNDGKLDPQEFAVMHVTPPPAKTTATKGIKHHE